jgi:hypothetical protein
MDDVMSTVLELEVAMFVKAESEVDGCQQWDEERAMTGFKLGYGDFQ